jgi:hypothetical protein
MSTKDPLSTGFDHAPGNDIHTTALSWHYYCWLYDVVPDPIRNTTLPIFDKVYCDEWQLNDYFFNLNSLADKLGGAASFLTEFGTCMFPIKNRTHDYNTYECERTLKECDRHFQSWTYWDSDFYYDTFDVNVQLVNAFSRVYPMTTNGIPQDMQYNTTTKVFKYLYNMNALSLKEASLNTEIFVPPHAYPSGFNVDVSTHLKWTYDQDNYRVLVAISKEVMNQFKSKLRNSFNAVSQITITPKK